MTHFLKRHFLIYLLRQEPEPPGSQPNLPPGSQPNLPTGSQPILPPGSQLKKGYFAAWER